MLPRYRYIHNNTSAVSVLLAPVLPFTFTPWAPQVSLHLFLINSFWNLLHNRLICFLMSNSFSLICLTICIRIVFAVACLLSWLKGALPGTLPKQLRAKKNKHCEAEMARQPVVVRAGKTKMVSQECRARVELIEISEFLERYPGVQSKTSKPSKENGKPKDGEGGKVKKEESGKVSGEPEWLTRYRWKSC